ncbi:MAG: hypothetical protein HYS08_09075 [Chlamydiae bacterium]|nr:hypothetical protein [Chlamydiota bacterium]MBI3265514.1 hypothetical protein [Chlamydiota bacterium]
MKEVKRLAALQIQILKEALRLLKSGGILVYSTCSIDPIENEEVVRASLKDQAQFQLTDEKTIFQTLQQAGGYWAKIRLSLDKGAFLI